MGGFGFTEAQEMFRREVRNFARQELPAGAKERAKRHEPDREMIAKLAAADLLGISLPEKYGGQGGDWISMGIAMEEMGKVDFYASLMPIIPGLAYTFLSMSQEDLIDEWLPPLIKGDKLGCFGVTEADSGSDAAAMKTVAVRDGDDYIITGEKISITNAAFADACIFFAKTDPSLKHKGISAFWVPMDLPGIVKSPIPHTGWKPAAAASIFMDSVRLPAKYRVGDEGQGFYIFGGATDYLRVGLGLIAIAMAEASVEETIANVQQRMAFGKPIAQFEGVSFKIAEHATRIEAAKLLCYRAFYLKDQGMPHTKESAMVKWWCPEVAFNAVHDCLLLHGHVGYSEEAPLEQRLRDVMGFEFADGTAQIMKLVIVRQLIGKAAIPY
ncbi:MAG: acyl-CoA dehydrogenase family protein [Chloroflexota bacterium]|nr:acyl-CoA dehydrogenase family protein [Chloroflexota bacterium]